MFNFKVNTTQLRKISKWTVALLTAKKVCHFLPLRLKLKPSRREKPLLTPDNHFSNGPSAYLRPAVKGITTIHSVVCVCVCAADLKQREREIHPREKFQMHGLDARQPWLWAARNLIFITMHFGVRREIRFWRAVCDHRHSRHINFLSQKTGRRTLCIKLMEVLTAVV